MSTALATAPCCETRERHQPLFHVVLLDDNDHTYEYVIVMLQRLFAVSAQTAYRQAAEVDNTGRVIVATTSLEDAEFKCDQIHACGADSRLARSAGSMGATVEPAPE
jgi:ATP-dependent Clp protease adaptor protein ClpS